MAGNVGGIIDQTLIDQAVAQTRINGTEDSEYDPDMFIKLLSGQVQTQRPIDTVETDQIVQQQAIIAQVEQSAKQVRSVEEQTDAIRLLSNNLAVQLDTIGQSITEIRDFIISTPEDSGDSSANTGDTSGETESSGGEG